MSTVVFLNNLSFQTKNWIFFWYISGENLANFFNFLRKSPNFQYDKIEEKKLVMAFHGAHILYLLEECPMLES
jgi:hypothetical protein